MPHQCVRCGIFYDDGDQKILQGCECGGKLFFFIKKEKLQEIQNKTSNLTQDEKKQIEKDVYDIVGSKLDLEEPVILDLESIRVTGPGKYEIDLVNLFNKEPLIFKLDEGKYMINLLDTFKNILGRKKEKK